MHVFEITIFCLVTQTFLEQKVFFKCYGRKEEKRTGKFRKLWVFSLVQNNILNN